MVISETFMTEIAEKLGLPPEKVQQNFTSDITDVTHFMFWFAPASKKNLFG